MFESIDGGSSFRFICANATGADSLQQRLYNAVLVPGGRLIVGSRTMAGAYVVDACDAHAVAISESWPASDLTLATPDGDSVYALVTSTDGDRLQSRLFRSTDRGDSWSPFGAVLPPDFVGRLAVSPASPDVIYAYGTEAGAARLLLSSDGGTRWQACSNPDETPIQLVATHPTRAEVLLAIAATDASNPTSPGTVWLTTDSGSTWRAIFESGGPLTAASFSPNGSVILAGGAEGLFRAAFDRIQAAGGDAFEQLHASQVWGAAWNTGKLYVGDEEFSPIDTEAAMVSVSSNDGATFVPFLRSCAVTFPDCGAASPLVSACKPAWFEPSGYLEHFPGLECNSVPKSDDAGAGTTEIPAQQPPRSSSAACNCRLSDAGTRNDSGAALASGMLIAVVVRRCRRRTTSRLGKAQR